jgi:adenylate kinase family enzyme
MPTVLLLTGPGGAGKTTIAKLIASRIGFAYVDGDKEDSEFFPDGYHWLPEKAELLRKAHEKIFGIAKNLVGEGKDVVVDYIIFGYYLEFMEMFRKEFGDTFHVRVLFPTTEEVITRDREREIWTTGEERIKAVSQDFLAIKDIIGAEKYLDTTHQTPDQTFEEYFASWLKARD